MREVGLVGVSEASKREASENGGKLLRFALGFAGLEAKNGEREIIRERVSRVAPQVRARSRTQKQRDSV